ncbi:MAG: hypothetical protein D3920_00780 [Candidatus Electrothrix sp. AW2]|nr:hypothetical protein [Candidatus Electrothrix gigas]
MLIKQLLIILIVGVCSVSPVAGKQQTTMQNAALAKNGGRVSLRLGPTAGKNAQTPPQSIADGNIHTRCVTHGTPPVTYRIDLITQLPIQEINFITSDYALEETPKEIEITLSGGTVIKKTLDGTHSVRGRKDRKGAIVRQKVAVGKEISWLEMNVLSNHPGGKTAKGKVINWGGLGEIEAMTTADLAAYLIVPDYNPQAPAYIDGGRTGNDYSNVKVTLPSVIPLGTYPGIYLTKAEIADLHEEIKNAPKAQKMYQHVLQTAEQWRDRKILFPDPEIPAQVKNRGDAQAKAHDALALKAGLLGWAYQFTGDEKIAEKTREILVGYAQRYPAAYKEHKGANSHDTGKVMAQRLSEAMWLLPLIQAYDMIHDAECMTEADRDLIENDLILHALTFINSKRSAEQEIAQRNRKDPNWRKAEHELGKGHGSNWVIFYAAAYIQGGIVCRNQDWIDIGAATIKQLIASGIKDDGTWGEGSMSYQVFERQAFVPALEALARKGINLYSYAACRVKNLWDSSTRTVPCPC